MPTICINMPSHYEISRMSLFDKLTTARNLIVEALLDVANAFAEDLPVNQKSQLIMHLANEVTILAIRNVNDLLDESHPDKLPCLLAQEHLSPEHRKEVFYQFSKEFGELFMRHLGLPADSFRLQIMEHND